MRDLANQDAAIESDQLDASAGVRGAEVPRALLREFVGMFTQSRSTGEIEAEEHKRRVRQPRRLSPKIEYDAECDCRYARKDAHFSNVVHVFHQNWHGIRSAAGALPGHKIAIPSETPLRRRDLIELVARLSDWRIKKAVFHGYSDPAERIASAIAGGDIACYLVWHGNLSQLVWEPEVYFFEQALNACRRGMFRRAHMLKAGMGMVFPRAYEPMLLNSPPITGRRRLVPAFSGEQKIALIAAHTDIRKNIYSSLLGAASSNTIQEVLYYGKIRDGIAALARCKRIAYGGHDRHIAFLHDIDVSVNVTSIDCHPMVDLEALGAGAMALSGPLFLDALAEHPFSRLSVIENPFDVRAIAARLDYLSAMDNGELQEIITDYSDKLKAVSRQRYADFLEL